jgi:Ni,Fe-hydrogenase maturation factor
MKTIVLCYGNEFIKEDCLAKEIADEISIPDVEFIKSDSLNDVICNKDCNVFILDVVRNSNKVIMINDIDQLKEHKLVSLHDFDLAFFLKLMKGLGNIHEVKIIGIPQKGDKNEIIYEIKEIVT